MGTATSVVLDIGPVQLHYSALATDRLGVFLVSLLTNHQAGLVAFPFAFATLGLARSLFGALLTVSTSDE